jgi:pyruvate,orthophosphate dikinase
VQDGRLFMLQTRNGKRTGVAALRVAIEMEAEGLVTPDEAVLMVEPRHLDQLLHPMFVSEKVGGGSVGRAVKQGFNSRTGGLAGQRGCPAALCFETLRLFAPDTSHLTY